MPAPERVARWRRRFGALLRALGLIWLALAVAVVVAGAWLTRSLPGLGDGLLLLIGVGLLAWSRRLMG